MTKCLYCDRPAELMARFAHWATGRRWWLAMPRTRAVLVDLQRHVCLVCGGSGKRDR